MVILPASSHPLLSEEKRSLSDCSKVEKHVRFDSQPVVQISHTLCLEDCCMDQLWYKAAEIRGFKTTAVTLAREISKHDAKVMDDHSYHRMLERALEAAEDNSTLSADELSQFFDCVSMCPSRLGLEQASVKELSDHRAKRHEELMTRVKVIQKMAGLAQDKKELLLRLQCEKVSRPSRIFAHELAEGLAPQELALEL